MQLLRPLQPALQAPLRSALEPRIVAGGSPPAFSPADLFSGGETGAWYDPSDITTLFQDSAGTVPVTASGQTCARINDKSGNNQHLLTAAGTVTYQVVSGKGCLRGDGSAHMVRTGVAWGSAFLCSALAFNVTDKPGSTEYWFCMGSDSTFTLLSNYLSSNAGVFGGLYVDGSAGSLDVTQSDVGIDYAVGHTLSTLTRTGRVTVDGVQVTAGGAIIDVSTFSRINLFCVEFGSGPFGIATGDFYGGIMRLVEWDDATDLEIHAWLAARMN